jgi:hypothetical protein
VQRNRISQIARDAANSVRSDVRGEQAPATSPTHVATGILMRSAVVSGWPGLEVAAYTGRQETAAAKIPLLRMERLAPDVLLVIFADVPGMVVINQPKETFHFGVDSITHATRNLTTFASDAPGIPAVPFRGDGTDAELRKLNVVDIKLLRDAIRAAVPVTGALRAANFAIEMVDSAGKYRFFLGDQ